MANDNSIVLGANTAKKWFASREIDPTILDYVYYGTTVAQNRMFYGPTWAPALIMEGRKDVPGVLVSQACTTSTTCIHLAAANVEAGTFETAFALMSDRCSNGPHVIWPNSLGPGGEVLSENWVMDSFNFDPYGGKAMIETAENVAAEAGITKEECDAVALRRYEQYQEALKDDRAFQRRYMFPVEVTVSKKKTAVVEEDEGVFPSTAEGLARLKPVIPNGVLTFGTQTHPADGNCAFIVTTREKAAELSADPDTEIRIVSYGFSRVKKAHMASAPVPAAEMALRAAGLKVEDMKAVKTHNPFAVNDLYMARKMNVNLDTMNNYGSSLVFGHPQGPTAGRLIAELIEELVILGGGYGLWAGCAAGDTGAALIVKVG